MNTDSLFLTGDHKICQDYCLHGEDFIIVSDGCSSSKDTDIGARILCHTSKQHSEFIKSMCYFQFGRNIIELSKLNKNWLNLDNSCLDATLLFAKIVKDKVKIYCYGDGNIIYQKKDGSIKHININFTSGAPYYLSYWIDESRKSGYEYFFNKPMFIDENRCKYDEPIEFELNAEDIKSLILCTDGMQSFQQNGEEYSLNLEELIKFKNTNGAFLERRINKYMSQLKKNGVTHYDDFGIASITF